MGWRDKIAPLIAKGRAKAQDPEVQRKAKEAAQKAMEKRRQRQSVPPRAGGIGAGAYPIDMDDDDVEVCDTDADAGCDPGESYATDDGGDFGGGGDFGDGGGGE